MKRKFILWIFIFEISTYILFIGIKFNFFVELLRFYCPYRIYFYFAEFLIFHFNLILIFETEILNWFQEKLTTIVAKYGTKVKDTLKQYNEKIFGFQNDKIIFLFDGKTINKNENQVVEKFFGYNAQATITVYEVRDVLGCV